MRLVNNREAHKYPVNFIDCEINGHELEEVNNGHFFSYYIYKDRLIECESQDHLNKGIFYIAFPNTRNSSEEEIEEFRKMGLDFSFRYYDPCMIGCTFLSGKLMTLIEYIDQLEK